MIISLLHPVHAYKVYRFVAFTFSFNNDQYVYFNHSAVWIGADTDI